MTEKEAYKMVENLKEEYRKIYINLLDKFKKDSESVIFYTLVSAIINYLWYERYPKNMIRQWTTGQDHKNSLYGSRIRFVLSTDFRFDPEDITGTSEITFYKLKKDFGEKDALKIMKSRKEDVINSLLNCDNLLEWILNYFD